MGEIKLEKRYPHSREEDITDAFMRGYVKGKADRPQGEWVATDYFDEWYGLVYKCNICGSDTIGGCDNYCPNCGAQMKGADNE